VALLALGGAAAGGCTTLFGDSGPRRISFEAGPFVKAIRALDRGAQAHYRSTVGMVALATAAVKAGKLKLPAGVDLAAYQAEATVLIKTWNDGVDTVLDTMATAKDAAVFDSDKLKEFAAAIVPIAEVVMKILPLLAAVAL
jgi:hypothetical protein